LIAFEGDLYFFFIDKIKKKINLISFQVFLPCESLLLHQKKKKTAAEQKACLLKAAAQVRSVERVQAAVPSEQERAFQPFAQEHYAEPAPDAAHPALSSPSF
jgi:hypothetical protein